MGVYVGNALGLGFWSKLDDADQDTAVTFDSVEDAKEHVCSWEKGNDPNDYTCVAVDTDGRCIHKSKITQHW